MPEEERDIRCDPRWQFRVFTDCSNGFNSATYLAPALIVPKQRVKYGSVVYEGANGKMLHPRLLTALTGTRQVDNPFVFTTTSLLLAIQHSMDKTAKGHANACCLCIDTWKIRTTEGNPVNLRPAVDLMRDLHMDDPKAYFTGIVRDFDDVYLTSEKFILGPGCSMVTFKTLKELGLFRLFPDQGKDRGSQNPKPATKEDRRKRGGSGLETPVRDLRAWRYDGMRDLDEAEINLAAQLAFAWNPVDGSENNEVPMHLLAFFLDLKSQDPDGKKLRVWIEQHTNPRTKDFHPSVMLDRHPLREKKLFAKLFDELRMRTINKTAVEGLNSYIPDSKVYSERVEFDVFQKPIIKERREANRKFLNERVRLRRIKRDKKTKLLDLTISDDENRVMGRDENQIVLGTAETKGNDGQHAIGMAEIGTEEESGVKAAVEVGDDRKRAAPEAEEEDKSPKKARLHEEEMAPGA